MKTKLLGYLAAATLALTAATAPAANISVSVFYDALEPHGEWFETADYGYVWHPRDADDSWRPYTVGHWAYTDAGWTWVSEEPFGWATYHYGRWIQIERVGWSWVPDREWGPAWVSWRRSDRHVGWAPLPPEARFQARVGFSGWVDSYYDIGPTSYSFVTVRDFGAPRLRTVILQPRENITIIRETRNITNITYVNNVVFNEGPQYDVVVRESAQPIRRLKLERRTDIDFRSGGDRARFATQVSGDTLRIAAPEVELSRDVKPGKVGRKLDRVSVDRGWKTAGDAEAVQQYRTRVATEAKAPAELPPEPKLVGSDRPARGDRPQAATPGSESRPGAVSTDPAAPAPATAAPKRDRDMKPGAEKPVAETATPDKPDRERPKAGTTAETTAPMKEKSPGREGKDKGRTPAVAETAPKADKPAKAAARERGAKDTPPVAAGPNQETDRPKAAPREPMPARPDARDGDRPQPPVTRPDEEKTRKRAVPPPQNPAAETDRPSRERPEADRPGRKQRPEAAVERPDRPERPAAPPAAVPDREPKRKGPPAAEDRSPERSRPQAAERSPESRPPAPEARPQEAPKKGADKPPKAEDGAKDEKKKKD